MEERSLQQPGSEGSIHTAFTRQAGTFAESAVLGAPEQIQPILDMVHLTPADRLLDVGCGTGFLLVEAGRLTCQAVGLDLTPAMLDIARRRADAEGVSCVTLREGNAEALPFADDRFDVVVTRLTLHHMRDPQRVLSEMHRVLRPGGRFAVCDIIASEDPARADLHNRLERLRDPSHVQHYAAAELERLVEGAGLHIAERQAWSTLRHLDEWVQLAVVRPEVLPALEALLAACIEGDKAGIQAGRAADGGLTFYHHWLVVGGVK